MSAAAWDELRSRTVPEVGVAFGLTFDERRRALSPCPVCSAEKRHPKRGDKRGAIGLRPDGLGWRCHECDTSGDGIALVAYLSIGKVPGKRDPRWLDVVRAAAGRGLCAAPDRGTPTPAVRPAPRPRTPPQAPRRPVEVVATWARCASAWLKSRELDPATCEERDVVRALPRNGPLPDWMRRDGGGWRERGFRVVVPLYGPDGRIESLHARNISPCDPKGLDKATSPFDAEVRGLVMADALARLMLSGAYLGDGITPAAAEVARVGLAIAEGAPDYLSLATNWSDADEAAPAVLGIISGSWTEEIAARIPDGTEVFVLTDRDDSGQRYAKKIITSLAHRCRVRQFSRA